MRRLLTLSLACQLFVISAFAQVAPPPPPPPPPESSTAKPADYSQEGFVIEKSRTAYQFENDGTGKRETYARIRVQSEAGVQQWGQLIFSYSSANETVDIPYVRVTKADGSTVAAGADAVQDLSSPVEREAPVYSDLRQKHVTVPALRPGDTLEYDLVVTTKTPLAPGQFWMEYRFANTYIVLDEELQIDIPHERKVTLKTEPGMDPKISEANGRRIYRWSSSHTAREDDDDKKVHKKKREDQFKPAVQMTTFSSWAEMGRWYANLEKDRRQPNEEIRKKAAALTAGKSTDVEKIQALYDYVATNFRYISLSFGLGRYQPHAAADVLHNEYGDCKDKHTLLASLLEASGYQPSSVLINSSRKLDPDVPSPMQFDHVISLVPLGKDEIWMDTTTEVAPFRLLASPLRKKQALVIPVEGIPHLEETPADPPMGNMQTQSVEGKINDLGKLNATVDMTARGDVELFIRILLRRIPRSDWQRFTKRFTETVGLPGEVSDIKIDDPSDTKNPFHIHYQVAVSNFFDYSKKKGNLALPVSSLTLPDADEEDTGPDADKIPLAGPQQFTYHCKLELPQKYVASAPLPFSMKRDYGEYHATYKVEGNIFTAERGMTFTERELPPSRTADYLAFRRAVYADLQQQLAIDSSAAGDPTRSADLKGDELDDAAEAALRRGDFQLAVNLFNRVLDSDPKHKSARANLGRAYMGLHDYDKAIDAFQKQASLNPYDEFSYNNLGWAYSTARKYDKAAAAFAKALEINPLSQYAHRTLAGMYAEQHKYEQAIVEFEKAASLLPNDPLLQVNLGDAYLNAGKDDKALAAFDRALSISATPLVWNNIAYNLSLKGSHLDLAQQYAESAVAAIVAESRNLRLDQLSDRDLAVMNSLMAYWDTLGWVYFAKGDFEKAEKYVLASARLDPRSDAADHLGQIYEKLGKKDEAIRAYSMSLSGIRPDPETRGRLAKLVGGDSKVDAAIREFGHDLTETSHLSLTAPRATADYFLLFGPNGTIEDAKFVSGDDKLKTISDALRAAKYSVVFPDENPGRILRRGKVTCGTEGSQTPALTEVHGSKDRNPVTEVSQGCSITFAGISDVHSVN